MSKKGSGASLKFVIETVILLVIICLSWYGAEMLLYGYSQGSIVKAIVALWVTARLMMDMEKERVKDERIEAIARGVASAIKKREENSGGKDQSGQQSN